MTKLVKDTEGTGSQKKKKTLYKTSPLVPMITSPFVTRAAYIRKVWVGISQAIGVPQARRVSSCSVW